jgi:hypothetical protein
MKLITGWAVSAGLVLAASAANAQMPAPSDAARPSYRATSDFDGPYPAAPEPPAYRQGYGYGRDYDDEGYGYGPPLMPPIEVYAILRETGFLPLGIPHQRGFVYTIAVINRAGADGRLTIDARSGRILRFEPAGHWGEGPERDAPPPAYGQQSALPPPAVIQGQGMQAQGMQIQGTQIQGTQIQGTPRPPASIPRVASRAVPLPKPAPMPIRPAPDASQQSAVVQAKPADTPLATGTVGQVKPPLPAAPVIKPTEAMPKVQGLE